LIDEKAFFKKLLFTHARHEYRPPLKSGVLGVIFGVFLRCKALKIAGQYDFIPGQSSFTERRFSAKNAPFRATCFRQRRVIAYGKEHRNTAKQLAGFPPHSRSARPRKRRRKTLFFTVCGVGV